MELLAVLFKASYQLRHHEWAGVPLHRWWTILLLIVAGLFAVGLLPGRLAGVVTCSILLIALLVIANLAARRQFVVFRPEGAGPRPNRGMSILTPGEKILLRATGSFEVEGKEQSFCDLQATFRTFETREHTLMAIVPPSKILLVGRWPDEQIGMWYIFFKSKEIRRLEQGQLSFGRQTRLAMLIDLEQIIPPGTSPVDVWGGYRSGNQKPKSRKQALYLAFDSPTDRQTVLDDLLADAPSVLPGAQLPT